LAAFELGNAFSELKPILSSSNKRFAQQLEERAHGDDEAQPDGRGLRTRAGLWAATHRAAEGLGVDRLVMLLNRLQVHPDVILFP